MAVRSALLEKSGLQTDALFFSVGSRESAERLDVRTVHRIVSGIAEAKGLPAYHPHQLRHACATHMHDHGAPLQAVATMLGHARLSTTQIYTRVSTGRMLDVYQKAHPHENPIAGDNVRLGIMKSAPGIGRTDVISPIETCNQQENKPIHR